MKNLNNILENLITKLDLGVLFICLAGILTTLFLLEIIFALFLREHSRGKRTWFLFVVFACYFLVKSMVEFKGVSNVYPYLTLALGLMQTGGILSIRERKRKPTKEQKKLAKFIDEATKIARFDDEFFGAREGSKFEDFAINYSPKKEGVRTQKEYELNFSHVKSVIDKLDYYGLSANDKKQVLELERAIKDAETDGFSLELKSRINDGLGALLKIMSKYGV